MPVFSGIWVAFTITGGSLYFFEFLTFSPLQFAMFFLGVVIMFGGVVVLSRRLQHWRYTVCSCVCAVVGTVINLCVSVFLSTGSTSELTLATVTASEPRRSHHRH